MMPLHVAKKDMADAETASEEELNTSGSTLSGNLSEASFEADTPGTVTRRQKQLAKKLSKQEKEKRLKEQKKKEKKKISKSDFFTRQQEFRIWLQEEKCIDLDRLPEAKAREVFKKFVKKWNSKKLDVKYYRGTECWVTASPSTQSLWAMPSDGDLNITPGSMKEEDLTSLYSRTPSHASFSTFGRGEGRRLMDIMRDMPSQTSINKTIEAPSLEKRSSCPTILPPFLSLCPQVNEVSRSPPKRVESLQCVSVKESVHAPPPPPPIRAASLQHIPNTSCPTTKPHRTLQALKRQSISHQDSLANLPPQPPTYEPTGSLSSLPPPPDDLIPEVTNSFIRPKSGFGSLRCKSKRNSIRAELPFVPSPADTLQEQKKDDEQYSSLQSVCQDHRSSVPQLPGSLSRRSSMSSIASSTVSSVYSSICSDIENLCKTSEIPCENFYSKSQRDEAVLKSSDGVTAKVVPQALPKEAVKELYSGKRKGSNFWSFRGKSDKSKSAISSKKGNGKGEADNASKKSKNKSKKHKGKDIPPPPPPPLFKPQIDLTSTKSQQHVENKTQPQSSKHVPPPPPPPPPPIPSHKKCEDTLSLKTRSMGLKEKDSNSSNKIIPPPPPPPPPPVPSLSNRTFTRSQNNLADNVHSNIQTGAPMASDLPNRPLPTLPAQKKCKPPDGIPVCNRTSTECKPPPKCQQRPKSAMLPPRATMLTPTSIAQKNKVNLDNVQIPKLDLACESNDQHQPPVNTSNPPALVPFAPCIKSDIRQKLKSNKNSLTNLLPGRPLSVPSFVERESVDAVDAKMTVPLAIGGTKKRAPPPPPPISKKPKHLMKLVQDSRSQNDISTLPKASPYADCPKKDPHTISSLADDSLSPKRRFMESKENLNQNKSPVEEKRRKVMKQDSYAQQLASTSPVIMKRLAAISARQKLSPRSSPSVIKSPKVNQL